MIDRIAMDVGIPAAAAGDVAVGEHAHDFQEFIARHIAKRIGAAHQCE